MKRGGAFWEIQSNTHFLKHCQDRGKNENLNNIFTEKITEKIEIYIYIIIMSTGAVPPIHVVTERMERIESMGGTRIHDGRRRSLVYGDYPDF